MMLFHPDQARELQAILDLADEGNEAFTLPELHGFMYGLAITPDVVALSEWVPVIFGGEMPVFDDEAKVRHVIGELMIAYNQANDLRHAGELRFPSELGLTLDTGESEEEIAEKFVNTHAWCRGFFHAYELRSSLWLEGVEHADDELAMDLATVQALGWPDQLTEIFEDKEGRDQEDHPLHDEQRRGRFLAACFRDLAECVRRIQSHTAEIEASRLAEMRRVQQLRASRTGRNEPCPCGSGKKFKKCCGAPGKLVS